MSADGDFVRATDLAAEYVAHMKRTQGDIFVLSLVFQHAARYVELAMLVRNDEIWADDESFLQLTEEMSAEYMRLYKMMSQAVAPRGQKVGESNV